MATQVTINVSDSIPNKNAGIVDSNQSNKQVYNKLQVDQKLSNILLGNNLGLIKTTDTPPATGKYHGDVASAGTYTNFKDIADTALVFTQPEIDENFCYIYVVDNISEKVLSLKPSGANIIDGFESESTTDGGSAKNDKILSDSIKNLTFGASSGIPGGEVNVPHGSAINVGTFLSFTDDGANVNFNGNTIGYHYGKVFNFTQDKFIITNIIGAEWITFGQKANGDNIAIYVKNDSYKGSIGNIITAGNSDLTGIVATLNFNPNTSQSFTFKYLATTIEIYNNEVLWTTISKSAVNFNNKIFGITQAGTTTVSYTYEVKDIGVIAGIGAETVSLQVTENGFPIVFSGANIKYLIPFLGKKVTLYGDSISVAYDSANYASQILAKLGCDTVTRSGESGQSLAGNLQNTTNVNALVATTPALVVIHSVNDHRLNATIGTMADSAGTVSTIGGLKTICNALITANKNVKIILCTPLTYGAVAGSYPASNEPNASGKYMFEYASAMINFARSYGITIADLSSLCEFRPQIEGISDRVFTSDGVHPSSVGYEVMTTIIAQVANKM